MLTDAVLLLLAAVVLGALLAIVRFSRARAPHVPWPASALHGLLGAGGTVLAALAPAIAGAAQAGAGGFRWIGVTLLCLALVLGVVILSRRVLGRRLTTTIVGIHALLAISGVVVLSAYLAVG
jgi:hypothetical protein